MAWSDFGNGPGVWDSNAHVRVVEMGYSAGVCTVKTESAHGLATGDKREIDGARFLLGNGGHQITVVDANTFTFAIEMTRAVFSITLPERVQSVVSITRVGTTATATVTNHGLQVGDTIVISGADQAEYNGTFTVAQVQGTDILRFLLLSEPAVSPATGTIALTVQTTTALVTVDNEGHGLRSGYEVTIADSALALLNATHTVTVVDAQSFRVPVSGAWTGTDVTGDATMTISDPPDEHADVSGITAGTDPQVVAASTGHPFYTGDLVYVHGADQADLNGVKFVVGYAEDTFRYRAWNAPTLPGTGTIKACRKISVNTPQATVGVQSLKQILLELCTAVNERETILGYGTRADDGTTWPNELVSPWYEAEQNRIAVGGTNLEPVGDEPLTKWYIADGSQKAFPVLSDFEGLKLAGVSSGFRGNLFRLQNAITSLVEAGHTDCPTDRDAYSPVNMFSPPYIGLNTNYAARCVTQDMDGKAQGRVARLLSAGSFGDAWLTLNSLGPCDVRIYTQIREVLDALTHAEWWLGIGAPQYCPTTSESGLSPQVMYTAVESHGRESGSLASACQNAWDEALADTPGATLQLDQHADADMYETVFPGGWKFAKANQCGAWAYITGLPYTVNMYLWRANESGPLNAKYVRGELVKIVRAFEAGSATNNDAVSETDALTFRVSDGLNPAFSNPGWYVGSDPIEHEIDLEEAWIVPGAMAAGIKVEVDSWPSEHVFDVDSPTAWPQNQLGGIVLLDIATGRDFRRAVEWTQDAGDPSCTRCYTDITGLLTYG